MAVSFVNSLTHMHNSDVNFSVVVFVIDGSKQLANYALIALDVILSS